MPKDYANKRMTPVRVRNQRLSPVWLWLIGFLIVILFITGLGYVRNHHNDPILIPLKAEKSKSKKVESPPPVVHVSRKVQFDFYTVLPSGKTNTLPKKSTASTVNVQVEPLHKPIEDSEQMTLSGRMQSVPSPVSPNKAASEVSPKMTGYILQMAAFKRVEDADQLKDQLDSVSFKANVTQIENKGVTWYRVWIGPFTSAEEAKEKQKDLKASKVKSIIVKVKE